MKGITHFAAGVAVASCFPHAVEAGANGNPLYFILGGCFGLLPDTFDFKFSRFFHKHDIEVAPDPARPDPQMIADAVALSINRAHETGKPVRLKLNTIRLGSDLWQRYEVRFDVPAGRVVVSYGPAVDTGRQPATDGAARRSEAPSASSGLDCEVKLDYLATTVVDIFDGPFFEMTPAGKGAVTVGFLPWHRAWSHSLTIGLMLGSIAALIWGVAAGVVGFFAHAAHVGVDQLGFMGSNLLYPFTSRRLRGAQLMHSGQAMPNLGVVWASILLIFWNLSRYARPPAQAVNPIALVLFGIILPAVIYRLLRRVVSA